MFLYSTVAFLFIKSQFSYIKWEQNYISKVNSMMTQCLDSKKAQKDKKTSFLKETVESADLHKAVINKTMATHKYCV